MTSGNSPGEVRKAQAACSTPFITSHDDLIHSLSYDFYGERLVTCSSDQRLKVFDLGGDGEWKENDSWRAHDASISRVAWAHPEFGQVIASCSFDRMVKVWEEQETEPKNSARRWKNVSRMIGDVRGAIYDISFAPVHVGLKLAYISSDGTVQLQEAIEPHNVSRFTGVDDFRAIEDLPRPEAETSFCITFCPSSWGGEQLLVGAMDKVRIYRRIYRTAQGKFEPAEELPGHKGLVRDISWAPNLGRGYHLIATACKDTYVRIFKLTDPHSTFSPKSTRPTSRNRDHVSPNPSSTSVTRAGMPSNGSGSNLQAGQESPSQETQESLELQGFKVEEIAAFGEHGREVWRVEWNATGTILSSAGDDGKIRLWKADNRGNFKCMSVVSSNWRPNRRKRDEEDED